MKPSLMSVSSFNSRGKVARPDCLTTFEFEGAVLSCSIVHFGSPLPVLVAVQPFGAAPIASASKLAVLSAMALASTEQRNAAATRIARIAIGRSRHAPPRFGRTFPTVTLHEKLR